MTEQRDTTGADCREWSLDDEADRLMGVSVGRAIVWAIVMVLIGADPWNGLLGLLDRPLALLVALGIGLWMIHPAVKACVLSTRSLRQDWRSWRGDV